MQCVLIYRLRKKITGIKTPEIVRRGMRILKEKRANKVNETKEGKHDAASLVEIETP